MHIESKRIHEWLLSNGWSCDNTINNAVFTHYSNPEKKFRISVFKSAVPVKGKLPYRGGVWSITSLSWESHLADGVGLEKLQKRKMMQ